MTATHFEARKWAYRQTKEGTVISFLVHPNDISSELATAALGTRLMVAFAQIGDDEKPISSSTDKPAASQGSPAERPKQRWNDMSRAQQAGVLCNDPAFQRWLEIDPAEDGAKYAAETVRAVCGVRSRADLDALQNAGYKWDDLVSRYRIATGQQAEMRS